MGFWAFVTMVIKDKIFRQAITSLLWPRIIKPFLESMVSKLFDDAYAIVLRSAVTAEQMADNGEIDKEDKFKVCLDLIKADAAAYGVEISTWARNLLIEIAVGEIGSKWEEFK